MHIQTIWVPEDGIEAKYNSGKTLRDITYQRFNHHKNPDPGYSCCGCVHSTPRCLVANRESSDTQILKLRSTSQSGRHIDERKRPVSWLIALMEIQDVDPEPSV